MAEPAKSADQSMEEILQSIKRIIAEEGEPAPSGSDVLELTDIAPEAPVEEAPTMAVEKLLDSLAAKEEPAEPVVASAADIEAMFATPAAPAPSVFEEVSAEIPEETPVAEPEPVIEEIAAPVAADDTADDTLIEDATLAASASALKQLLQTPSTPSYAPITASADSVAFRSGATVEDLVVEALRPMLKQWLDANLPGLVEQLVQREIQKIVATLR
jgi:uncharacterized protein